MISLNSRDGVITARKGIVSKKKVLTGDTGLRSIPEPEEVLLHLKLSRFFDHHRPRCQGAFILEMIINLSRKDWIFRKYVNKEWVLDKLPHDPKQLISAHLYETKVFQILNKINWSPPPNSPRLVLKNPSNKHQSLTQSTTIHKPLRKSAEKETSGPSSDNPSRISIPISPSIFASTTFPCHSAELPDKLNRQNPKSTSVTKSARICFQTQCNCFYYLVCSCQRSRRFFRLLR